MVQPRVRSGVEGDADKLSDPQKRRRRMQLLSASKAVANIKGVAEHKSVQTASPQELPTSCWEERLGNLEFLICQIHWHVVGHWQYPQRFKDSDFFFDEHSQNSQLENVLSELNPGAAEFVPRMNLSTHYDGFKSLPGSAWEVIHNRFRADVQENASVDARSSENQCTCPSEGSSSDTECRFVKCGKCGQDVDLEDKEADGCDLCAMRCHQDCLQVYSDLRGEWHLCPPCMVGQARNPKSISGDFRRLPSSSWDSIYARFHGAAAVNSTPVGTKEPQESCEVDPPAASFEALDSTLDYIVKFLEGEHVKSAMVSGNLRAAILEHVRSAMAWKVQARTKEEVQAKVSELNSMMCGIVSNL